jgi:hypothetical protein
MIWIAVMGTHSQANAAIWPDSPLPAVGESTIAIAAGQAFGFVPPFYEDERNVGHLGFSGRWAASEGVILTARYEALRAVFADGTVVKGSGDLRLGTAARLWTGTQAAPQVWLWWEAKLPNASDFEGDDPRLNTYGLGSDETDITLGVGLRWVLEPVTLDAVAGLAILGDPFSFANQDDAAVGWVAASGPLGPLCLSGRLGGRLPSPKNAADLSAMGVVEWAPTQALPGLRLGLQLQAGLTHMAPDVAGSFWMGHRWGP